MKFVQRLMDEEERVTFTLTIDFDTHHLSGLDVDGNTIDERLGSLPALQKVYRKRVAPLFSDERCYDLDRDASAEPIHSLAAFADELRACGYDGAHRPRDPTDPVEVVVAELITAVRRELNRAIGPEATTLEHVVFKVSDSVIRPAIKNPPTLTGCDESELHARVNEPRSTRWLEGTVLPFSMVHENIPWGALPSVWSDPWRSGPSGLLGGMLDLVAAYIEADPKLRANVEPIGTPKLLFAFREQEHVDFERRATARDYVGRSALKYFRACGQR